MYIKLIKQISTSKFFTNQKIIYFFIKIFKTFFLNNVQSIYLILSFQNLYLEFSYLLNDKFHHIYKF